MLWSTKSKAFRKSTKRCDLCQYCSNFLEIGLGRRSAMVVLGEGWVFGAGRSRQVSMLHAHGERRSRSARNCGGRRCRVRYDLRVPRRSYGVVSPISSRQTAAGSWFTQPTLLCWWTDRPVSTTEPNRSQLDLLAISRHSSALCDCLQTFLCQSVVGLTSERERRYTQRCAFNTKSSNEQEKNNTVNATGSAHTHIPLL